MICVFPLFWRESDRVSLHENYVRILRYPAPCAIGRARRVRPKSVAVIAKRFTRTIVVVWNSWFFLKIPRKPAKSPKILIFQVLPLVKSLCLSYFTSWKLYKISSKIPRYRHSSRSTWATSPGWRQIRRLGLHGIKKSGFFRAMVDFDR